MAVVPGGLVGNDGAAGGEAEEKREDKKRNRESKQKHVQTHRHTHTRTHTHTEKVVRRGWRRRVVKGCHATNKKNKKRLFIVSFRTNVNDNYQTSVPG